MKKLFVLLAMVLLAISTGCLDFESETITKTGYVEDVDFGGPMGFPGDCYTIVHFADGDTLCFAYLHTEIPLHQNVTLHYTNSGGIHFLKNVVRLDETKEKGGVK